MKRSRSIELVLIGGLSATALSGCQKAGGPRAPISAQAVYTNNYYVDGVGYYHAPFRDWYAMPYNFHDPSTGRYVYGGKWGATPFESIVNISSPTAQAAQYAESKRTDISRGGFGVGGYGGWG